MIANTKSQQFLPLEDVPADDRTYINGSLWFVDHDGYRVVLYHHEPLYRAALSDKCHLRFIAVSLRQSRLATQAEIVKAFGHSQASQQRWERRYERHGIDGLIDKTPSGCPSQLNKSQEACVRRWFKAGISNVEMGRRLCVGEATVRRTLKRLGLKRRANERQPQLSLLKDDSPEPTATEEQPPATKNTASPAEVPMTLVVEDQHQHEGEVNAPGEATACSQETESSSSFTIDHDPADRNGDRALARLGLLEDAMPMFADAEQLPRAGVLLAVPLLVGHGILPIFEKVYGSLGPAFYGLRTTVVALFLLALLRIKRPENLKEYGPGDLGRILGLDRAPEVKTVRRKLSRMAAMQRGQRLMEELARQRIEEDQDRIAFLYLDGHVREYHGKHRLFKAKKSQRQVAGPAATDTWVNDARGDPLLVVTSEVNAGLTQMLEPILQEVKQLTPAGRRVTVIFDRGGYSPKLFARLIEAGFDLITYRKGKSPVLPRCHFEEQELKVDGKCLRYPLCDQPRVRVGRLRTKRKKRVRSEGPEYLWLRQVTILREDGRQTQILTNRTDLEAAEVAYRIFNRWRQENFFKYMAEEFALDGLVEYGAEAVSEGIDRPNPQWSRLNKRVEKAKAEVVRLRAEVGRQAAGNDESRRRTMRGFKIAHADLRRELEQAESRLERLYAKRKATPKRIPASDLEVLKKEKKLVVDSIKMTAYQVETELFGMLGDHYARTEDEGRTLLHAVFQSPARLEIYEGELHVTIAAQSSPHRTQAVAALCKQLDALRIPFPGTNLRLRLAVETPEPIIS
jgi:transposase